MAKHPEKDQLVVELSGCFVLEQLTRAKEMLAILQQEREITGVTIGKKCIRRLVSIAIGIKVIPLGIVH